MTAECTAILRRRLDALLDRLAELLDPDEVLCWPTLRHALPPEAVALADKPHLHSARPSRGKLHAWINARSLAIRGAWADPEAREPAKDGSLFSVGPRPRLHPFRVGERLAALREHANALVREAAEDLADEASWLLPNSPSEATAVQELLAEGQKRLSWPISCAGGEIVRLARWAWWRSGEDLPPWAESEHGLVDLWPDDLAGEKEAQRWAAAMTGGAFRSETTVLDGEKLADLIRDKTVEPGIDALRRVALLQEKAERRTRDPFDLFVHPRWLLLHAAHRELFPPWHAWDTMDQACTGTETEDPREIHLVEAAKWAGKGKAHEDARGELAKAFLQGLQAARQTLGMDGEPSKTAEQDGMLDLTAKGAKLLRDLGETGSFYAGKLEEEDRKAWAAANETLLPGVERPPTSALWSPWLGTEPGGLPPFALVLCEALWFDRVKPEIEKDRARQEARGAPALGLVVTSDGRHWGKAPSAAAAIGWAWGASGERVDTCGAASVVVDGARYVEQPSTMGRYVAASAVLLDSGRGKGGRRTAQLSLDLPEPPKDERPLPLYVAHLATLRGGRGGELVSPTIGKVLLLMLATGRGHISIRDLAGLVYPEGTRIERHKHMVEVSKGLWLAKSLHVVTPEDLAVPVFSATVPCDPLKPVPHAEPDWSLTDRFAREFVGAGTRTPGDLLVCWTMLLGLGPRQGPELRAYMRAADLWNRSRVFGGKGKGKLHEGSIPEIPARLWVAEVNELSPSAVKYASQRRGEDSQRVELARNTRRAFGALEELERRGMIGKARVMGRGRHRRVRLLPPPELEEAYRKFRAGEGKRTGIDELKPEGSDTRRTVRKGRGKRRKSEKNGCE